MIETTRNIEHNRISAYYLDFRIMLTDKQPYPDGILENKAKSLINYVNTVPNGEMVLQEIADSTRNPDRQRPVVLKESQIVKI